MPFLNLQKEFHLKASLIKYLLWIRYELTRRNTWKHYQCSKHSCASICQSGNVTNTGNINAQILAGGSRGRRAFFRQTDENDPSDMSIAPLNIYKNQVKPIGIHNLSKSFRPNLSTIQVLSLGTKSIPKWKFEKRNNVFVFFKDFLRRMQNKVYFTEVKLGVYKKDSKFKLKTYFVAYKQHIEFDALGW